MKNIFEYIEQEYIDEINLIEESLFDDEEEQLEKVEKDLEKSLNIVSRAENCKVDEWLTLWITTYMKAAEGRGYTVYDWDNKYTIYDWGDRYVLGAKWRTFEQSEITKLLEFFKEKKCFTHIKYFKSTDRIEFKYNPDKDIYRDEYIKKDKDAQMAKIIAHKKAVEAADTSRWVPDANNIMKMKVYLNKKSNPSRIAKACGTDKLVQRWLIAMGLDWQAAVKEFQREIRNRGVLSSAEIEAYIAKYKDFKIE